MTSPSQRTMEHMRHEGWLVGVVEKWNMHVGPEACLHCGARRGIRQDLFGFADLIGVHPIDNNVVLVQATSGSNVAARLTKILTTPEVRDRARLWLSHPGRQLTIVGWKKYAKALDRKYWRPRWLYVTLHDLKIRPETETPPV